jgi:hypothetical protein
MTDMTKEIDHAQDLIDWMLNLFFFKIDNELNESVTYKKNRHKVGSCGLIQQKTLDFDVQRHDAAVLESHQTT